MHKRNRAFTIVELLIVIVIIAILAAVSVVAYSGIQNRASISVLQGDLRNAAAQINLDKARDDKYPASLALADEGRGISGSSVTSFQYTSDGSSYCLTAIPSRIGLPTYFMSNTQSMQQGVCPGHDAGPTGTVAVSTAAGTGSSGYVDGPAASARFYSLFGVAVAGDGTVYVADTTSHRIRVISTAGIVSTLAGNGTSGYVDGTGTGAQLYNPCGIAIGKDGNIYFTDTGNQRIRRVTPSGQVTTFAGSGSSGSVDGTGTGASFYGPSGIAVDSNGDFYVTDVSSHRIRKITAAGVVTTVAGTNQGNTDGPVASAKFYHPYGVAVATDGTIYIADTYNNRIRKISGGIVSTLAGSGSGNADGMGTAASFSQPMGVVVSKAGMIYVADRGNSRIRSVTTGGAVATVAGTTSGFANGSATTAKFNDIYGLTLSVGEGRLYVTEGFGYRLRMIQL